MTLGESCLPPPPTRHAPPAALLRAQGLHKRFGGVEAVRDISLAVSARPGACGHRAERGRKSTLLNLLSGLYQPDAGEMSFDGVKLVGLPAHKRARLGLARTFQKIRLFRGVSVLDNVIAAFHTRHDIPLWQYVVHAAAFERDRARCREEALRLLAFVGLEQRADLPAASLAYGEQRMLELARALAASPRLLMVDEPAAGLNGAEVERLIDRIRLLQQRGMTIIVVEHNMDLVMEIADRVLVMDYGQHLFAGGLRARCRQIRP